MQILFDGWTGDVSYLADSTARSTTVTMPEGVVVISVVFRNTTGIMDKPEEPKSITCYPNPANSGFSIELKGIGEAGIEIYNLLGKSVYNTRTNEEIHRINDHGLSSGIM